MAKIAVEREQRSSSASPSVHLLAQTDGCTVSEVVCSSGPQDRPFEEQHSVASIAVVVAGTFQYRSSTGCELMTPGSLLLGNAGQSFVCGHEHGTGDRCIAFSYAPEFFEQLTADVGSVKTAFRALRIPPIRSLSPLVAEVSGLLSGTNRLSYEELGIRVAAQAIELGHGLSAGRTGAEPSSLARITRVVRMMESCPDHSHDLASLAREARLSPYHFLRMFEGLTGATPHQYLLRTRLRRVAIRLRTESVRILDAALECGFGDVSNFNRVFRAEFGVSPRAYRSS